MNAKIRLIRPLSTFALLGSACVSVSATLPPAASEPALEPAPVVAVASRPPPPAVIEATSLHRLRPLDTTQYFDGEVEVQVPSNLVAAHPFGGSDVWFEFEQSSVKVEGQHKIAGAWEGQFNRWPRDPQNGPLEELEMALAHRSTWTLGPPGCDDSRNQCFVQRASKEQLETSYDKDRDAAQLVVQVGGTADEAAPTRIMLVTTLQRGNYTYALIYEVWLDQWEANEALLRASAASFDAHPPTP